MSDELKQPPEAAKVQPESGWDEPRLVVFLIGLCLLLEGGMIYYQAGASQGIVAGVTGVSGITLLLFAWLVPLEDEADEGVSGEGQPIARDVGTLPPPPIAVTLPGTAPVAGEPLSTVPPPSGQQQMEVPPTGQVPTGLEAEAEARRQAAAEAQRLTEEQSRRQAELEAAREVETGRQEEGVEAPVSWFDRLRNGLSKTRTSFVGKLKTLVFGKTKIDADLLEELEATLYESDIGPKTTQDLLALLHERVEKDEITDPNAIYNILKEELKRRLMRLSAEPNWSSNGTTVFIIIGVNGVGKTTTIAKLARKYIRDGKKVILAAGDTFRAAAIEQLSIWAERAGAEVIRGAEGGDPGALVFDAIHAARKRKADLLIVDTAGRMHVKANLMDELKKIRKIIEKETVTGPHEILLVIDATTGQNAVQQAKLFNEVLPISGLVVTKLDGTAKGGVIFSVQEHLSVPVKYIGVGEKMDDLMEFQPDQFLEALFSDDTDKTKKSDYNVL